MLMTSVLLLTLMSAVTSLHVNDIDKEWISFKAKFNRKYSTKAEEQYRYSVFTENFIKIYYHNLEADRGQYTYWLGVNNFADLTSEEFTRTHANLKLTPRDIRRHDERKPYVSNKLKDEVPQHIDWRVKKNEKNKTCVTPVKNQGNFNTCYAFAAAGVLESHNCLELGNLDVLSEQNIIDCYTKGSKSPLAALEYVMNNGLDLEATYPYKGEAGDCKMSKGQLGGWVEDIEVVPPGRVDALKETVANKGPVSVCMDTGVKNSTFQHYKTGVYKNPKCGYTTAELNHALLLVGYGVTHEHVKYWIIKNSYGTEWGENGYMRLERDDNKNTCGIATNALYPIED